MSFVVSLFHWKHTEDAVDDLDIYIGHSRTALYAIADWGDLRWPNQHHEHYHGPAPLDGAQTVE